MSRKAARIERLRREIPEIAPREADALRARGARLVDIREPDELAEGSPSGADRIVRGFLELGIEDLAPDPATPILLMCAGGTRSLLAAADLRELGYTDVRSVAGGFDRWKTEGLPVELPTGLDDELRRRYSRHLRIPQIGETGQRKLLDATVVLVGAGGLGSPAALYLAAAGVGTLRILDDDVVDRGNLQRQILHADGRVGRSKADSARQTLLGLNPTIDVDARRVRLTAENAAELLAGADVVLDGTDNFTTRYVVNDACVALGIPNVHGAVFRFDGQVSTFWPGAPGGGPCYRCLFPAPPPAELAPSCAEAGVLGVLPGVVGTLQAVEAIKLIVGIGEPLVGRLLSYDALGARFFEIEQRRDPDCGVCGAATPGF